MWPPWSAGWGGEADLISWAACCLALAETDGWSSAGPARPGGCSQSGSGVLYCLASGEGLGRGFQCRRRHTCLSESPVTLSSLPNPAQRPAHRSGCTCAGLESAPSGRPSWSGGSFPCSLGLSVGGSEGVRGGAPLWMIGPEQQTGLASQEPVPDAGRRRDSQARQQQSQGHPGIPPMCSLSRTTGGNYAQGMARSVGSGCRGGAA